MGLWPRDPMCHVSVGEMFLFPELILKMGHWPRDPMCHVSSYSRVMRRNRFLHILLLLHSKYDEDVPDRNTDYYDRLW
jgi:hypothetical protein